VHHDIHLAATLAAERHSTAVDVLVVGGGAAGTTAALVLARARHRVLLADDHTYRNRAVTEFHGFPTRDRTSPAAFLTDAHAELAAYGVGIATERVVHTQPVVRGARVRFEGGRAVDVACVVVATGVRDELPAIDGLARRWGRSAFNCPFCDGWEHRDRPVAVIDAAPGADHLAALLRSWSPQVTVVGAAHVAALEGPGDALDRLVLRDGTTVDAHAAFVKAPLTPRSELAQALGCAVDDDGYVITDANGRSTNPRVWSAGDVRRPPPSPHQVVLAAADGSAAAISIHKAFVAGDLAPGEPVAADAP
jgi:thioredoxin reductase